MNEIDFETVNDSLVNSNKSELRGNDPDKTYFRTTHRDETIFVTQIQELDSKNSYNETPTDPSNDTPILGETSRNDSPHTIYSRLSGSDECRINDILKELQSFKDFQPSVGSKLIEMKKVMACNSKTQKIGGKSYTTPKFVIDLLKNRISTLVN